MTLSKPKSRGVRSGSSPSRPSQHRSGVAVGATREIYYRPDLLQFHPVAGYSWKQGRFPVSVQLNVSNVFNTYNVLVMPNPTTGFNGPMIATLDNQPRAYTLSTTVSF
jgi:hypothetical protein